MVHMEQAHLRRAANRAGGKQFLGCALTVLQLLAASVPMTASAQGKAPAKPQGFEGLTCQSDIAASLVGRKMPNGKVVDIEARHKSIQLQYLGATGMPEDPYILSDLVICGTEYMVLEAKGGIVKGVLKAPASYAEGRFEIGECQPAGGKKAEFVVFHRPVAKEKGPWRVGEFWSVREPKLEFVQNKTAAVTCEVR